MKEAPTMTKLMSELRLQSIVSWEEWQRLWDECSQYEQYLGLLNCLFDSANFATLSWEDDPLGVNRTLFLLDLIDEVQPSDAGRELKSPTTPSDARGKLVRKGRTVLVNFWSKSPNTNMNSRFMQPAVLERLIRFFQLVPATHLPSNLPAYVPAGDKNYVESYWWNTVALTIVRMGLQRAHSRHYNTLHPEACQILRDHLSETFHLLMPSGQTHLLIDALDVLGEGRRHQLRYLATGGLPDTPLESVARGRRNTLQRELARTMIVVERLGSISTW